MRIPTLILTMIGSLSFGVAVGSPTISSRNSAPRARAGGDTTVDNRSSRAFTLPAANLDTEELDRHIVGDRLFETNFVSAPADLNPGLGPLFNNASCLGCHSKNGRGMPVVGARGTLRSQMLVRLSLEDEQVPDFETLLRGPAPVPGFGLQIQDSGVYGQLPEAKVQLSWQEESTVLGDGTAVSLRRPVFVVLGGPSDAGSQKLAYSLRQTPPIFGLGLLEAVADREILSWEDPDDADQNGISGRAQRVWDERTQTVRLGRFGWKASAPDLITQTAAAFAEDMGLSNSYFPEADGQAELSLKELGDTAFYMQSLGVPAAINSSGPEVQRGEVLFQEMLCASCHRPQLETDPLTPIRALQKQTFYAYTDLLLHDMGEGLADNRRDYLASGREWRTPPLWGLGLTHTVLPRSGFLHDGRARSIEEAILWHDGEARTSQVAYRNLSKNQRQDLLSFLKSL